MGTEDYCMYIYIEREQMCVSTIRLATNVSVCACVRVRACVRACVCVCVCVAKRLK